MRREDIGMRAARLAGEATPTALAQILAIRRFNMIPSQTPIHEDHWNSETYRWMIINKIIKSERVPGWRRPLIRCPRLTELGELLLLSAAENALRAIGSLPVVDAEFAEVD